MRRIPFAVVILLLACAAPAKTQDPAQTVPRPAPTTAPPLKSVTTARLLGIVPSAGHIYAGETVRGLLFAGGMFGVLALGTVALVGECLDDIGTGQETCDSSGTDTAVVVAFFGVWGWSIYDAGLAARRTNARRSMWGTLTVAPSRVSSAGGHRAIGLNVGMTIPAR